jgi:hypothetical protein
MSLQDGLSLVTLCGLIDTYQSFGELYCLHLQTSIESLNKDTEL